MNIQPYLCFEGRCEEAIEFYKKAVGAEIGALMRWSDNPEHGCTEGPAPPADKIMHAALKIGESEIFVSDGMCTDPCEFKGISLSLACETLEQVKERFQALADEGEVMMDLNPTFFASSFGMVRDRFGVTWMVLAPAQVPV